MAFVSSQEREMFGGAVTAVLRPGLIDASDFRQVPDTQEVFLYPDSSKSLILEVLQRVEPTVAEDAARFHFDSIAHDNSADDKEVLDVRIVTNDRGDMMPSPIMLEGTQTVKKFNATVSDHIRIFMALYRVEDKNADLVLTMNVPVSTLDDGAVGEHEVTTSRKEFETAALSLRVLDFGLFA